jgi:hypothetical protein
MELLPIILSLVNSLLANASTIEKGAEKATTLITALFTAKLLTVDQQNALNAHIESQKALLAEGFLPDYLRVEPDPA